MSITSYSTYTCEKCGNEFNLFYNEEEICPFCGVKLLSNGKIDHSWTHDDYINYQRKKQQETEISLALLNAAIKKRRKKKNKTILIVLLVLTLVLSALSVTFESSEWLEVISFTFVLLFWAWCFYCIAVSYKSSRSISRCIKCGQLMAENSTNICTLCQKKQHRDYATTPYGKYTRAFVESYESCVRVAQTYKSDIPNSEFKFEICAYLYYVVLIALIGGKSNGSQEAYRVMEEIKRSGIVPLNKHRELESRITLYNDVMAGRTQPRGDCVFGNTSALEGAGPLGSITIVLGDILVNSQCANNYDGAPFVLHGADTFIQVLSNVTIPVAKAGMSLFNKINVM